MTFATLWHRANAERRAWLATLTAFERELFVSYAARVGAAYALRYYAASEAAFDMMLRCG